MDRATEMAVQVHSVDPPHAYIPHPIEGIAQNAAPAFGWRCAAAAPARAA